MVGVTKQNSVVTVRAGGDHVNGRANELLHALKVATRIQGQLIPLGDASCRAAPTGKSVIDRLAIGNFIRVEGQDIHALAIAVIAHTNLDFIEPIEHIELGDTQTRDTVDDDGTLERSRIQLAAAARTAGHCAALLAYR